MIRDLVDVLVVATREVSFEPQPGIVEVVVFDTYGKAWYFMDKYPIFGIKHGCFPSAGLMRCQVLKIDSSKKQVLVSTTNPYQICNENNQVAEFWVDKNQLATVINAIEFSDLEVNHALY
jgi:hypothetical protein